MNDLEFEKMCNAINRADYLSHSSKIRAFSDMYVRNQEVLTARQIGTLFLNIEIYATKISINGQLSEY